MTFWAGLLIGFGLGLTLGGIIHITSVMLKELFSSIYK